MEEEEEDLSEPDVDRNLPEEVDTLAEPLRLPQHRRASKNEVVVLVPIKSFDDRVLGCFITSTQPESSLVHACGQVVDEVEGNGEGDERDDEEYKVEGKVFAQVRLGFLFFILL